MSALYKAMAAAFPEIEGAAKDSENAAFRQGGRVSKYADLSSVVDAIKPALVKHKLFFSQHMHEQQGGVAVETVLYHEGGESLSFGTLFVPAGKNDAHGYGSALTYARRYSLMTAFGVCPEDDDGNAAVKSAPTGLPPMIQEGDGPTPAKPMPPRLTGPIKTRAAVKDAIVAFKSELALCTTQEALDELLDPNLNYDNDKLLEQVRDELPNWWLGDGGDFRGLKGDLEDAYDRIKQGKQNG